MAMGCKDPSAATLGLGTKLAEKVVAPAVSSSPTKIPSAKNWTDLIVTGLPKASRLLSLAEALSGVIPPVIVWPAVGLVTVTVGGAATFTTVGAPTDAMTFCLSS